MKATEMNESTTTTEAPAFITVHRTEREHGSSLTVYVADNSGINADCENTYVTTRRCLTARSDGATGIGLRVVADRYPSEADGPDSVYQFTSEVFMTKDEALKLARSILSDLDAIYTGGR